MTILVTGGTGLVGERLLKRMAANGLDCRALVRGGKQLPAGITPIEGDILDPASLKPALEGVSAVVHLAALFRTQDTDAIWKVNVDGTRNLIEATREVAPDARFVMASTGLVYGTDGGRPGREDDAVSPVPAYPASKVVAEQALRESGLTWSILRLGFVYGEGDGHIEAIPKLADGFKWHPAQALSVIHHRDVAGMVDLALTGALDGRIVNVTDEAPTTMGELANLIDAELAPSSEPLSHPWSGRMDGRLARELGFVPTVATIHQARREGLL